MNISQTLSFSPWLVALTLSILMVSGILQLLLFIYLFLTTLTIWPLVEFLIISLSVYKSRSCVHLQNFQKIFLVYSHLLDTRVTGFICHLIVQRLTLLISCWFYYGLFPLQFTVVSWNRKKVQDLTKELWRTSADEYNLILMKYSAVW